MPRHSQRLLQEDDVAPVGVDVHLVGIEGEDAELHQRASSRRTAEPTWVLGRRDLAAAGRLQPRLARLGLDRLGAQQAQGDLVELVGELAGRGDRLAQAADDDRARSRARRPAAGWSRPSRRPRGRRAGEGAPPRSARPGSRRRSRPRRGRPGAGGGRRSAGRRGARRGPSRTWISCIGAITSANSSSREKSRASPAVASAGSPAAAARALKAATSSGSRSTPCTRCPCRARSRATRPVPQPRSRIGPSAEPASSRQSSRSPS